MSVSVRSFRSEKLSAFIHSILDIDINKAKKLYKDFISKNHPIKITRNFEKAKEWLKKQRLASERIGVIASS